MHWLGLEQTLLSAAVSGLGGLSVEGRSCSLLAPRLRGWGSAGIRPSAAREVIARWQEGLSVGLGLASTAEEWIPAGERGSAAPHCCHAGASRPLPAAGDKDTSELVLPQCPASLQSMQPVQGVLAGAVLWGSVSPTELREQAVPGHGCGFAISLVGPSPDTFKLFVGELLSTL